MDMHIPGSTGLDLLRELTLKFLNAKVIANSWGQGESKSVLIAAKRLDARHTIRKLFSLEQFLAAVEFELIL